MSIFLHLDYRKAISDVIGQKRKDDSSWSLTNLAAALRVQKTYISRVLKENAHLNQDQVYLAGKFLKLDQEELEYLFLLLEFNRSVVSDRKKELLGLIHNIQSKHQNTRRHLKAQIIEPQTGDKYTSYYLDPLAPLVHNYLSIPRYSKSPALIAPKLNITEGQLKNITSLLEGLEIIRWDDRSKSFRILKDHLQLASDSPLCLPYQILFRIQTLLQIKKLSPDERFNFAVTFTGNETARKALHEEFLKFLRKAESIVKEAPSERVYQMNFDLFPWDSI